MIRFLARRLVGAAVLVVVASSGALLLAHLAPGDYVAGLGPGADPARLARERAALGLDRPFAEQYVRWLGRAVQLDLGVSFRYQRPVRDLVVERTAQTALLGAAALVLASCVGVPLGVFTGSRRGGLLRSAVRALSGVLVSLPPLVSALIVTVLAARTGWLPPLGAAAEAGSPLGHIRLLAWQLALPAVALALPLAAALERLQSQALAAALDEPSMTALRARGLPRRRVLWHAVRLSLASVIGIYGLLAGSVFSGSFAVELVTRWPGLGQLMVEAVAARDMYLVAGCAAMGSLVLAAAILAADVALYVVDPRVRPA
ncbi:MAG TPA: ABC transporter permease [Vicinamibacterales bacterium]|nr:ABC transporter permease [Vicinamibacterales bacterium]